MIICILTLFPEMFKGPFDCSIIKRAKIKGLVDIAFINIRDFGLGKYQAVDERPYGGGSGMILRVDVLDQALTCAKGVVAQKLNQSVLSGRGKTILLDPQGKRYSHAVARSFTTLEYLILICGHYEGVDERVKALVDEEISIGDYVLTGGEIPAIVVVDSVVRLVAGVLTPPDTTRDESFAQTPARLEYPQYTQPRHHKNMAVPEVLLTGNHAKISQWRHTQALVRTRMRRPDLAAKLDNPNRTKVKRGRL